MNPVLTKDMAEFNRLYKETDNIYTRYATSQGVSTTTLCVLYSLFLSETPCTQTQLVDDWGIPMQTINSCLKSLEKSGTVRLEFAEGNRKSKCILLTCEGKEMAERIIAPLIEAENNALDALEAEQRQLLMALTRKHAQLLQSFLFSER